MTCVVFGFAVGAVPDGALTWPMQHAVLYASRSVDGVPTIIDGVITAAGWVSYVKPVIYCGLLGALGGVDLFFSLVGVRAFRTAVGGDPVCLFSFIQLSPSYYKPHRHRSRYPAP